MKSDQIEIEIKAHGQGSKIEIEETQKVIQIKNQNNEIPVVVSEKKQQSLMKLYVYGSRQSDQYYHPQKESESKRPICLTDIQDFDLSDEQNEEEEEKKNTGPILNPLFKKNIYKIACGGLHTVVLTQDGKAYTFGCNDEGALGRKGPECIPIQVQLDHPVDLISAGDNHTMFANSANGIVYFTGNYNYLRGQKMVESVKQPIKFTTASLDIRNKGQIIQKLESGANHTVILVNGRIFCRGEPESFTTGRRINERRKTETALTFDGVGLNNVTDVWCGGYHTIAKVKKGKDFTYHAWGKNDLGQLGIGSYQSKPYPVQIESLRAKNVIKVAAGTMFTLFLLEDGSMLGCGSNQYGQLGVGEDYQYIESSQDEQLQEQNIAKNQSISKDVQKLKISGQEQLKMISQNQQSQQKIERMQIQGSKGQINVQNDKKTQKQKNIYIKSLRPIVFPSQTRPTNNLTQISAGSQFSFAWNNETQLYSWGFGMNFVLLTGKQDEQYSPYQVRNKIINNEIIQELKAGGQHVVYTGYKKQTNKRPSVILENRVTEVMSKSSKMKNTATKLSRKRN